MKQGFLIGSTLVVAAAALVAQSPAHPIQLSSNAAVALPADSCPVSMHALQGNGHGLIAVRDQRPSSGFAQRIHLALGNRQTAKVVSAKVVVQGYSGKGRMAQASTDLTADLTKTLSVSFTPEENGSSTDLVLPGFTAVSSIRLESIAYDDGSTWKVAAERTCRVAPDPLLLVAATH